MTFLILTEKTFKWDNNSYIFKSGVNLQNLLNFGREQLISYDIPANFDRQVCYRNAAINQQMINLGIDAHAKNKGR